jgi:nucleoside-diphosphate-sugar epimerase
MNNCIIFGGSGFIGSHFSYYLLSNSLVDRIYVFDLVKPVFNDAKFSNRIFYIFGDVRQEINSIDLPHSVAVIANFAAIHREPGHEDYEYYETNLLGAENVTQYAESIGCKNIIFTSSISPYGVSEAVKHEGTLPLPSTAYGGSKLVAEKIHQIWQAKDEENHRLVIVRPGVVFGPGEKGNVSRLIKAVLHNYFFYMGNQSTRKAGVYVKELCNAMWWVFQEQRRNGERVSLFNMTMNPGPTIKDYVETVCQVRGVNRFVFSVPYKFLIAVAYLIDFFAKPLGIKHPFSPVRIRKLVRSNNILPSYLLEHNYQYQYSLNSAFVDWQKSCPSEWE